MNPHRPLLLRPAVLLFAGAVLAAALAWALATAGVVGRLDLALLQGLAGTAALTPIYVASQPGLAAVAAAGLWLLRPRTGRRGRLAGILWVCAPCMVTLALWWLAKAWWPPFAPTTAILAVAALRRWRRRRFPELEPVTALQSAADSALREGSSLPCSLVRLQLRGPGTRRLPVSEIALVLKARARRGGDRLARSGADGFVLWLAHTDAEAALDVASEIRADLAPLLARHDLRCSIGIATESSGPGHLAQLWQQAVPPSVEP
ncbi:MAG TPA: hypothetical protein VM687_15175 [Stenotrophomonas sp.]|nr:hypothetical protein [Stenotrophomonas sp.]